MWAEPSEVIHSQTQLYELMPIFMLARREGEFVLFFCGNISDVGEMCFLHCRWLPTIPSALVCGMHRTENICCWKIAKRTHFDVLFFLHSSLHVSEPLLSAALESGLITVGCKFKLLLLEDSCWVWKLKNDSAHKSISSVTLWRDIKSIVFYHHAMHHKKILYLLCNNNANPHNSELPQASTMSYPTSPTCACSNYSIAIGLQYVPDSFGAWSVCSSKTANVPCS